MIPKIIHYCWFGRNPKPKSVVDYIEGWKRMNPDFIVKEWNEDNFDYKALPFTRDAYAVKKYAFVSDVARMYALYTEGGIYLDTDVRVLKPFAPYLNNRSFVGRESHFLVSTAVIGAEKRSEWVKQFLNYYNGKHFIKKDGTLYTKVNTLILSEFFNTHYNLVPSGAVTIYDADVFSAKLYAEQEYIISDRTVSVHEFASTWKCIRMNVFSRLCNLYLRMRASFFSHE